MGLWGPLVKKSVCRLRVRAGVCTHKCVHVCTGCGCVQVRVRTSVYMCAQVAGACRYL